MSTKEQRQIAAIKRTSDRVLIDYATDGVAGIGWYDRAHLQILDVAGSLGTFSERVAGVLSALSPRVTVGRNCRLAAEYLVSGNRPDGVLPGSWVNVQRGEDHYRKFGNWSRVGSHDALKIRAFARALNGDPDAVVGDTWIAKAFGINYGEDGLTHGAYGLLVDRFTRLADKFDVTPADFQAAVWVGVRGSHGLGDTVADITLADDCLQVI